MFFTFFKELLNFKHLLNRSENGIKVILYATMVAAILVQAYGHINALKSFKIPKQKLSQEIETENIRHLIQFFGGISKLLYALTANNTS